MFHAKKNSKEGVSTSINRPSPSESTRPISCPSKPSLSLHSFKQSIKEWQLKFQECSGDNFTDLVEEFTKFLAQSIDVFPGPKHSARKFYELRKSKRDFNVQRTYAQSSNPTRQSKRDKTKR